MPVPVLRIAGHEVAAYTVEPDIDPTLVPRPYLHPVRTLAGTVVTDMLPADHEWHLGAGLAIADVAGTNLWGGRSYVHGRGYVWLPDHGRIDHVAWKQQSDSVLEHDLVWRDHERADLLAEHRTIIASEVSATTWQLTFATTLTNVRQDPIEIRSPATNGRGEGAGYGGFFWRLPSTEDIRLTARDPLSADVARGENQVNGSTLPALTLSGRTGAFGGTGSGGGTGGSGSTGGVGSTGGTGSIASTGDSGNVGGHSYSLTFSGLADADRWFVRAAEYPAVGVAFAYRHPLVLNPGGTLARTFTVTLTDT